MKSLRLAVHKLILISLVLISSFLVVLFWQNDTLSIYDASGHVGAVTAMRNYWPLMSGWNPKEFLGIPQGIFYPSFLHYLAATLSFVFGVVPAIKLLVSIALLVLPLTIYQFTKSFIKDYFWATLATVLVFGVILFLPDYLGGGVRSVFRVGLLASFFVMPIFFLFCSRLPNVLRGKYLGASLLLALLALTHLVAGVVGGFFLVVFVLASLVIDKKTPWLNFLKTAILALALTSLFTLPFLVFRQYAAATTPEITPYLVPNVVALILAGFLLLTTFKKRQPFKLSLALASFLILFIITVDALATKIFGFDVITHNLYLFRLQPFAYVFLIVTLVAYLAETKILNKKFESSVLVGAVVFLIVGLLIKNPATVQKAEVTLNPNKQISGRFLESFRRLQTFPAYYSLQTKLNLEFPAAFWANGLFAESASNSPYVGSLVKSLHPDLYPEGSGTLLESKFIDQDRVKSALDVLAINWLINLEASPKEKIATWTKGETTKYYNLEKASQETLFETTDLKLIPVKNNWDNRVEDWWLEKGPIKNLLYLSNEEQLKVIDQDLNQVELKIVEADPLGTRYRLNVNASENVPILAKISYFPSWKATSNGQEVKIHRSSPNLMLFEATGDIVLEYQTPQIQIVGYIISIVTLCLVLVLALRKRDSI